MLGFFDNLIITNILVRIYLSDIVIPDIRSNDHSMLYVASIIILN